jgi:hypothetical protein
MNIFGISPLINLFLIRQNSLAGVPEAQRPRGDQTHQRDAQHAHHVHPGGRNMHIMFIQVGATCTSCSSRWAQHAHHVLPTTRTAHHGLSCHLFPPKTLKKTLKTLKPHNPKNKSKPYNPKTLNPKTICCPRHL